MAKIDFKSVAEYIAAQPEAAQKVLELVRSTIRRALPEAAEMISYRMPAYKSRGEIVIYFAGWKQHYSLYPVSAQLLKGCKHDFSQYQLNDRGTLRLPLAQPVPVKLIASIARLRAKEFDSRARIAGPKERPGRMRGEPT